MDGHVHTIFKMDNNKEPTVEHGTLSPMLRGNLDGRAVWGEWIHVYVRLESFTVT